MGKINCPECRQKISSKFVMCITCAKTKAQATRQAQIFATCPRCLSGLAMQPGGRIICDCAGF